MQCYIFRRSADCRGNLINRHTKKEILGPMLQWVGWKINGPEDLWLKLLKPLGRRNGKLLGDCKWLTFPLQNNFSDIFSVLLLPSKSHLNGGLHNERSMMPSLRGFQLVEQERLRVLRAPTNSQCNSYLPFHLSMCLLCIHMWKGYQRPIYFLVMF